MERIERGASPLAAALAAGVVRRTWYRWLKAAEDGSDDPRVRHLGASIEKAKGRLATLYYGTMNESALGYERVLRKSNGEAVLVPDENGVLRPVMERVPGQWQVAARMLESLDPEEFLRPHRGGPASGYANGGAPMPNFEMVYLTSNRDSNELAEITRRVRERMTRA